MTYAELTAQNEMERREAAKPMLTLAHTQRCHKCGSTVEARFTGVDMWWVCSSGHEWRHYWALDWGTMPTHISEALHTASAKHSDSFRHYAPSSLRFADRIANKPGATQDTPADYAAMLTRELAR